MTIELLMSVGITFNPHLILDALIVNQIHPILAIVVQFVKPFGQSLHKIITTIKLISKNKQKLKQIYAINY